MSDTEHTPGPWWPEEMEEQVEHELNDGSLLTRTYRRLSIRANSQFGDGTHSVSPCVCREDDARLIAASPDYHEAVGKERLPGFNAIDTIREAAQMIEDTDLQTSLRQIASDLEEAHDKATR